MSDEIKKQPNIPGMYFHNCNVHIQNGTVNNVGSELFMDDEGLDHPLGEQQLLQIATPESLATAILLEHHWRKYPMLNGSGSTTLVNEASAALFSLGRLLEPKKDYTIEQLRTHSLSAISAVVQILRQKGALEAHPGEKLG
jgi:hypothetical protein